MDPAAVLSIVVKANTARAQAGIGKVEAKLHSAKAAADDTDRSFGRMSKTITKSGTDADRSSHGFNKLGSSAVSANQGISLLGKSISLLKFPAMAAAIGPAVEGVNALAGGVAALAGEMAPAAGLATAYGTALGTLGQVQAVIALSGLKDVGTAVGTVTGKLDKQSTAFKRLSPEAQKFAETLDKFQAGPLRDVQKAVQKPLFNSFTKSLKEAKRAMPAFEEVLQGTARAIGTIAEKMGKWVGSKQFSSDFQKFGDENNRVLTRMGDVLVNLGKAFLDVMVAARPLTEWLSKSIKSWSDYLAATTEVARKNGDLADFFKQTQRTTSDWVSILADVGKALWNIIQLGQPLGNQIVGKLREGAEELRKWTESTAGRNTIKKYFEDAKPILFEIGKLIMAVGKTFFELGKGNLLLPLLRSVRKDLLPAIESVAKSTGKAFGPHLVDLLKQMIRLFGNLGGANGPLTIYVDLLSEGAKVLNWMLKNIPGFKQVVITLMGLKAVGTALSVLGSAGMISRLTKLKGALSGVAGASAGMNAASGMPTVFGKAGKTSAVSFATRFKAALPAALAALGIGAILTAAFVPTVIDKIHETGSRVAKAFTRGFGSTLKERTKEVVKATRDLVGQVNEAASKASIEGLKIPRGVSPIMGIGQAQLSQFRKDFRHTINGLKDDFGTLVNAGRHMSDEERKSFQELILAARHAGILTSKEFLKLNDAMDHSGKKWHDNMRDIAQVTHETFGQVKRDVGDMRARISKDFPGMVEVVGHGVHSLVSDTRNLSAATDDTAEKMHHSFTSVEASHGKMTRGVDKNTDKLTKDQRDFLHEVQKDNRGTDDSWRQSSKHWDKAHARMSGSTHSLAKAVAKGEKNIQDNTNKSLAAFGAKKLNYTIQALKAEVGSPGGMAIGQTGGVVTSEAIKLARGGMTAVPGSGSGDHVPALLEPGEVIVNREAVKRMGGAKKVNEINKVIPRFQEGGIIQRFALGGLPKPVELLWQVPGHYDHLHAGFSSTPITITAGKMVQDAGYLVGEGPGPFGPITPGVHVPNSYHYRGAGQAIDVNWPDVSQEKSKLDALYSAFQHGTALGGAIAEIARQILKGPDGPLKDMGQGALDLTRDAANKMLAKLSPLEGAEVAVGPGVLSRSEVRALLKAHNMPDIMGWVALAESGLNPRAVSSANALGLWQILMPMHQDIMHGNPFDPNVNAAAASSLYHSDGLTPWNPSRYGGAIPEGWGPHVGDKFQMGGIVQELAEGGTVFLPEFLDKLPNAARYDFFGAERKDPATRTHHIEDLLNNFKNTLLGYGMPEDANDRMGFLAYLIDRDADYAARAAGLTEMKSASYDKLSPFLDAGMEDMPAILGRVAPGGDLAKLWSKLTGSEMLDANGLELLDANGEPMVQQVASAVEALRMKPQLLADLKGPFNQFLPPEARKALAMIDNEGYLIPEKFQGANELTWLGGELQHMLQLRNRVIDAVKIAEEEMARVQEWIDRAEEAIKDLKRELQKKEHDINQRQRQIDRLNDKLGFKQGDYKHENLADALAAYQKTADFRALSDAAKVRQLANFREDWRERERKLDGLRDLEQQRDIMKPQLPAMTKAKDALLAWQEGSDARFTIPGAYTYSQDYWSTLNQIQGIAPSRKYAKAPRLGVLGGDFFELQRSIKEYLPELKFDIGVPFSGAITGTGADVLDTVVDDNTSELLALTQQLLQEARQRAIVLEAQMPVFGGFFAKGGFIPGGRFGVVGEAGPEFVSGPAQVTPGGGVTVDLHFANGMEWLRDFVHVEVRDHNRATVSKARRRART